MRTCLRKACDARALAVIFSVALVAAPSTSGQLQYASGQSIAPEFAGWVANSDGSFDMVFGYMNRNYEEHPHVPIGPNNKFEPGEIDRMVREAEQHSAEDRSRREEIDARNELDALAYRVEQLVNELQDRLPVNERARAEQLVADARQAVQDQAPLDRVRPLIADLQQVLHSLPSAASAAAGGAQTGGNGASGDGAAGDESGDEEVVDAEFTRE